MQCLACFVCGQLRTTCSSYPVVKLDEPVESSHEEKREIAVRYIAWFALIERECPGTLLNNCGYALWQRRYELNSPKGDARFPWGNTGILRQPLSTVAVDKERHISQWAAQLTLQGRVLMLFGCTEDITCNCESNHVDDLEKRPYVRRVCADCAIPVCLDCVSKMRRHAPDSVYSDGGTVPMSLSNDHYVNALRKPPCRFAQIRA